MHWTKINDELVDTEQVTSVKQIDEDTVEIRYFHKNSRTLTGVTASQVLQKITAAKAQSSTTDKE